MIRFSVVIAVYNKEQYLASTLDSVLAQVYPEFEVIIVNDGSTDGSENIIKSYLDDARITYISQENQGVSAARNRGIKAAKYDYVAFIDADDFWEPNYLETQKNLIEQYPDQVWYATSQYLLLKGKKNPKKYSVQLQKDQAAVLNFFEASRRDAIVHTSAVVIKKPVFERIGMFNPGILTGEDTDLWIRIALEHKVAFCNTSCSVYNLKPGGLFTSSTSAEQLLNLDAYKTHEQSREDLKRYLDLNRYAQAIQTKLWGQKEASKRLVIQIAPKNLNNKQRFLLKLPRPLLSLLLKVKSAFEALGVRLTTYS